MEPVMASRRDSPPTDHNEPLDDLDASILAAIRELYELADPPPAELAEMITFAVETQNVEFELAAVIEQQSLGTGVRGADFTDTITFGNQRLEIRTAISVSATGTMRIDGWLAPPGVLRVELAVREGPDERTYEVMSDEGGRFVLDDVVPGWMRLRIHPVPGSAVPLARPVATPIVKLPPSDRG